MAEQKKRKGKTQARVLAPPLAFDDLTQRGEKALLLIERHSKVVDRLEAGTAADLRTNLDALSGKRSGTTEVRTEAKASTATQNVKAEVLRDQVTAIRVGVGKSDAKKDVKKAYGVGLTISPGVVTSVVSAGRIIVKRAETKAEEARALGILPADVASLKQLIVEVTAADQTQERLIAGKPLSTRERNEAGQKIWKAIRSIAAKGVMAYALEEKVRAEFDVLDDLPPRKRAQG